MCNEVFRMKIMIIKLGHDSQVGVLRRVGALISIVIVSDISGWWVAHECKLVSLMRDL